MGEWLDTQEVRLGRKLGPEDCKILSVNVLFNGEAEVVYKEPYYEPRKIWLHKEEAGQWLIYKLEKAVRTESP